MNKQLGIGEFGIVQQGVWTNGTERVTVLLKKKKQFYRIDLQLQISVDSSGH